MAARQVWEANTDWQNTRVPVGSVAERDCGQYSVHKVQTVPATAGEAQQQFYSAKADTKGIVAGLQSWSGATTDAAYSESCPSDCRCSSSFAVGTNNRHIISGKEGRHWFFLRTATVTARKELFPHDRATAAARNDVFVNTLLAPPKLSVTTAHALVVTPPRKLSGSPFCGIPVPAAVSLGELAPDAVPVKVTCGWG